MHAEPYVNGYLYSDGQLAVGAPSVAPVVELTNGLQETLHVAWANRVRFDDGQELSLLAAPVGSVAISPGDVFLVTNLYASHGALRSVLLMWSETTGLDMHVLNFSADVGYYLQKIAVHWELLPGASSYTPSTNYFYVPRKGVAHGPGYAPQFCGSQQPKWKRCILLPCAIKYGVSPPAPALAPAAVPCA